MQLFLIFFVVKWTFRCCKKIAFDTLHYIEVTINSVDTTGLVIMFFV